MIGQVAGGFLESVPWRHSCRHLPDGEMNLAAAR
jgi:hypothetical protein